MQSIVSDDDEKFCGFIYPYSIKHKPLLSSWLAERALAYYVSEICAALSLLPTSTIWISRDTVCFSRWHSWYIFESALVAEMIVVVFGYMFARHYLGHFSISKVARQCYQRVLARPRNMRSHPPVGTLLRLNVT